MTPKRNCRNAELVWLTVVIFCRFAIHQHWTLAADVEEKRPAWPKVSGAVFALRNTHFSTPKIARDAKGRELMAFECAPRGPAHVGRDFDLLCDGGSFLMKDAGHWIGSQVSKAGSFTLELMMRPRKATPSERGVVLAFCDDNGEDVSVLQDQTGLRIQFGTAEPVALFTPISETSVHLLIACDSEKWTAYRDGLPIQTGLAPAGTAAWGSRNLVIGSACSGKDPWLGRVEAIAVFAKALTADEAKVEATTSHGLIAGRKPARTLHFRGTLLKQANTSDVVQIRPYTRSLTAVEYKIDKLIAGEWKEPTITVYHWMILDGKRLPIADRLPGAVVEMSVENLDDHPQLESFRRDDIEGDISAELFYRETEIAPR